MLLDIEGTTTPIAFVYDVLFPFARARMQEFLTNHASEPAVLADINALQREHAAEATRGAVPPQWQAGVGHPADAAARYALWLTDQDRKSTALKSLQGKIWEAGYVSGEVRGEVYPDVAPALERWKRDGRSVAIFSSGSVQAQKLLFRYSTAGDLTHFLDAYFDTTTGLKQEAESYRKITAALRRNPQEVLFLSDVVAELDAAKSAGMQTALSLRPGNRPTTSRDHPTFISFSEIL